MGKRYQRRRDDSFGHSSTEKRCKACHWLCYFSFFNFSRFTFDESSTGSQFFDESFWSRKTQNDIFLLFKAAANSNPNQTGAAPSTSETNPASGFPFGFGGFPGFGNMNFPNTNLIDMQQQFQQQVLNLRKMFLFDENHPNCFAVLLQMMNNPSQLRQLMESPIVQSITNNPDLMRSLLLSNPQMRDLMEVFSSFDFLFDSHDALFILFRKTCREIQRFHIYWIILICYVKRWNSHEIRRLFKKWWEIMIVL